MSSGDLQSGTDNNSTEHEKRVALRKAASASFIGNFIEWFDYASYGYLALVISKVFFPKGDSTWALLLTLAIFAMSFILRPIGAILWGTWGDKFGRRWALSWSILLMSGATFLIAFIPSYAAIGIAAPILLLLLRMVQGFSASGEYAGAASFLAEYAPKGKRGLYTSLIPASTAVGLLVGSLFATVLTALLSDGSMAAWGWRIPFFLAGPLGLIGRYIRVHLEDSPVYNKLMEEVAEKEEKTRTPLVEVIVKHWRKILIAFGVASLNATGFYLILSYMPTYLAEELDVKGTQAFLASTIALAVYIGLIFFMGHISDRVGRKRMLIIASVAFIVLTVPLFALFAGGSIYRIVLIEIAFVALLSINDGTLATFLAEVFPTNVRYTGFALSFNLANALLGGTAPMISTWLIAKTGSSLAPAYFLAFIALCALGAMIASKETAFKSLESVK